MQLNDRPDQLVDSLKEKVITVKIDNPRNGAKHLAWERKNKPLRIKLKTRDDVAGVYIFK